MAIEIKRDCVWVEIVKRERFVHPSTPAGGYGVLYELSCGHLQRRKGSQEPKGNLVRCPVCERDTQREVSA